MNRQVALLRGDGRYLADLCQGDISWASFVRSSHPHAVIRNIMVADEDRDEDIQLFTGEDIARIALPARVGGFGVHQYDQEPIASDRARYVGEAVGLILGRDRYLVEDCAEHVQVEYEPLPIVASADEALAGKVLIHPELRSNILFSSDHDFDEVRRLVDDAPIRLDHTFRYARQTPLPLEGRGILVSYDALYDALTIYSSTQVPQLLRAAVAQALSLSENQVRVIRPDVGGGFGLKTQVWGEELALAALAKRLRQTVCWVEDRRENLLASSHAHDVELTLEIGATEDGGLLAATVKLIQDVGAHNGRFSGALLEPVTAISSIFGPYKLPAFGYRTLAVATNKVTSGAYRGVGGVPAALGVERMMDILAARIGVSAATIRRRNLLTGADFPYTSGTGKYHESGNYLATFEACLQRVDELEQTKLAPDRLGTIKVGTGIACVAKSSALGSAFFQTRPDPGYDGADVRVGPDGMVTVYLGTAATGSQHDIAFEGLVSRLLTIPRDRVRIIEGDTALCPPGTGSVNSRTGIVVGAAVHLACDDVIRKAKVISSRIMKAEGEVELIDGVFVAPADGNQRLSFETVAKAAHAQLEGFQLPEGIEPGLGSIRIYDPPHTVITSACHSAKVEVDTETGAIRLLSYVVAEDSGPSIDEGVVHGQTLGATAQGIGCSLFEEILYDDNAELRTGSLMDYLVPLAGDLPNIDIIRLSTPSDLPGGYRGVGEPSLVAVPAAIANAVADALGSDANLIDTIPITPERVLRLLGKL